MSTRRIPHPSHEGGWSDPDARSVVKTGAALVALLVVAAVPAASAAEMARYPNGTSGIKGGSLPPTGYYYLMYNLFYSADRTRDRKGKVVTGPADQSLGFDLDVYANAHRFIHVTPYQFLGAQFSWNIVLPIVHTDLEIEAFGIDQTRTGLGDLNVEPFVIQWRSHQWDFGLGWGFFAPTGRRDRDDLAPLGKGYWAVYPILGTTYFFDAAKSWSASVLARYEISLGRQSGIGAAGDNFSFEWGLGKAFGTLDLGVSGYASWQVTDDKGARAVDGDVHDRAFGVGPEIQYFFVPWKVGFHLRHWREFLARDRSEGHVTVFTLVKSF